MTREQAEFLRFLRIDRKMYWKDVHEVAGEMGLSDTTRSPFMVRQANDMLKMNISDWINTPHKNTPFKEPEI